MKTIYYAIIVLASAITISCSSSDSKDAAPSVIVGNVTTLAGSVQGFADGTGPNAMLYGPKGMCIDSHGDFIFADAQNDKIRKFTLTGMVTTIAGSTGGFLDDAASLAKFNAPLSACTDAAGNIYVTDCYNHKIRKISPTGYVSTFAGSTPGFADGTGSASQFKYPSGICIDANGIIYVADSDNNKIRKITPTGVVTTYAGSSEGFADGFGADAKFNYPYGICIDRQGNLLVSDINNNKIRKIMITGEVKTIAGSSQGFSDGPAASAQFYGPQGLTLDPQGNIYVADFQNCRIRKITPSGMVSTLAGSAQGYNDGLGEAALFLAPAGILYHQGKIYVSDYGNNKIRVIE